MNDADIQAYVNAIELKEKYKQWRNTLPSINFDSWAELFHPQWYKQFIYKKENGRSN